MLDDGHDPLVAAVIIGRNEGQRLIRCLNSIVLEVKNCVYVDSGSTDQSIEFASSFGVDVIVLDPTIPFTSPRARQEGLRYVLMKYPDLRYIQFVDGDSELQKG